MQLAITRCDMLYETVVLYQCFMVKIVPKARHFSTRDSTAVSSRM